MNAENIKDIINGAPSIVSIDLERFFDTVYHSRLLEIVSETIKDGGVISLIQKYLKSGVMTGKRYEPREEGTPQGGR